MNSFDKKLGVVLSCILVTVLFLSQKGCDQTKTIADIPGTNAQHIVKDLPDKSTGWVEPWTMWCDRSGQLFINEEHQLYDNQFANAIKIEKIGLAFKVDISGSTFKWEKDKQPGFAGNAQCSRVVEVIDTGRMPIEK